MSSQWTRTFFIKKKNNNSKYSRAFKTNNFFFLKKCHSIELNRKSSITAVGRHHSPRDFIKFPEQKKKMYVERINRNIGMNESVMIAAAVNPSQSVEHIFGGEKKNVQIHFNFTHLAPQVNEGTRKCS